MQRESTKDTILERLFHRARNALDNFSHPVKQPSLGLFDIKY